MVNIKSQTSFINKKSIGYFYIAPISIVLLALVLYPFIYGIYISFFDTNLVRRWDFVGLSNYRSALSQSQFWNSVNHTVTFTIWVVLGHFFLGLLYATLLNQDIRFKTFFRAVLLLPWIFPEVVIANVWKYILLPSSGLLNGILLNYHLISEPISFFGSKSGAMASIIFICIWKGFPLVMIQILAGLQTVPGALKEAAIIDGASPLQTFWKIIIPSLKTTLVVTLILDTVWWFKHVTMIWLLTQGGPNNSTNTLAVDIYKRSFEYFDFGTSGAIAVIVFIICALISLLYRRFLNED